MPSEIEKVRTNIDIELACNDLLKQTPASRDRKHLVYFCPFHKDVKTPNLKINHNAGLHRGSYRCFACGESGDIFNLYQVLSGSTFPEAVTVIEERFCGSIVAPKVSSKSNRRGKKPKTLTFNKKIESWPLVMQKRTGKMMRRRSDHHLTIT